MWKILGRDFIWLEFSSMGVLEVSATNSAVRVDWQVLSSNNMDPILEKALV